MVRVLAGVALFWSASSWAQVCDAAPADAVTSPDGHVKVFVVTDKRRSDEGALGKVPHETLCMSRDGVVSVLLEGKSDDEPERSLVSFADLVFSPDSQTVFFTATGWVTSPAAHAVELKTRTETYLFDGVVLGGITKGPLKGKYVASHFRIDDQHAVTSPLYEGRRETWSIVTKAGKTVRRIGENEAKRLLAQ